MGGMDSLPHQGALVTTSSGRPMMVDRGLEIERLRRGFKTSWQMSEVEAINANASVGLRRRPQYPPANNQQHGDSWGGGMNTSCDGTGSWGTHSVAGSSAAASAANSMDLNWWGQNSNNLPSSAPFPAAGASHPSSASSNDDLINQILGGGPSAPSATNSQSADQMLTSLLLGDAGNQNSNSTGSFSNNNNSHAMSSNIKDALAVLDLPGVSNAAPVSNQQSMDAQLASLLGTGVAPMEVTPAPAANVGMDNNTLNGELNKILNSLNF